MKYFKKLVGQKVYLSPLNAEDAPKFTEWVNDLEVAKYLLLASSNVNQEKERDVLNILSEKHAHFAIVYKETNNVIGICSLHNFEQLHQTAELGIFIGDKNYWNRSLGTEAMQLILDYGFNILNLHQVSLWVVEYNKRAIRAYQKVGFREAGKKSQAYLIAGKRHDLILMEILAADFTQSSLKNTILDDSKEKNYGRKLEIV